MGSDLAHVTLVSPHAKLIVEAATGPLAASIGAAVTPEGSMAGWVIDHAQPLVLNDPDKSPTYRGITSASRCADR